MNFNVFIKNLIKPHKIPYKIINNLFLLYQKNLQSW